MTQDTRLYPIDNERRKGFYVAKLDGPDPKYVVGREFLSGRKVGKCWEYVQDDIGQLPAWLIRAGGNCDGCGRPDPKQVELIAAFPHGWQVVAEGLTSADMLAVWETGVPGADPDMQVTDALTPEAVGVYAENLPEPF